MQHIGSIFQICCEVAIEMIQKLLHRLVSLLGSVMAACLQAKHADTFSTELFSSEKADTRCSGAGRGLGRPVVRSSG